MKNVSLLVFEAIISAILIWLGLSGKQFVWIKTPRTAAITLSVIGFFLCATTGSIGKFISTAPAHPLTLCGYVTGVILLAAMIAQVFTLKLPVVGNPRTALIITGSCIVLNGLIARFQGLLVK